MISVSSDKVRMCARLREKSLAFLGRIMAFSKRGKKENDNTDDSVTGMKIDEENMQRRQRLENPGARRTVPGCRKVIEDNLHHHQQQQQRENDAHATRMAAPSPGAKDVDVVVECHSILTLTPGRTRNLDQDMEALRLSRQDNPFLQILSSRENLIEPLEESESDDTILMSQDYGDNDPLTLVQVHEHLVRSPPPASWSRTPVFQYPLQSNTTSNGTLHSSDTEPQKTAQQQNGSGVNTPKSWSRINSEESPKSEHSSDSRDRHSHTFSLLNPTPIRRLHRCTEDSVQLMSSES